MADRIPSVKFDKEQKKAIEFREGPLLVLAGPGSGKTTVLTHRILYLNRECHVPEEEMLVLTFTRAAAEEMKERYLKLKGTVHSAVTFGTFHSVFYRILREKTGFGEMNVCDRESMLKLIGNILEKRFGKEFSPGTVSEELCDQIGRMKNGMPVSSELAASVYSELIPDMQRQGLIDYDDMLLEFLRVLTDDPEFLKEMRNRYRTILVDEFQDLNRTQYEILRLLAGNRKNVFAVGDDDQSIYGFRGSDPALMKQFLRDFRPAGKILLSVNHRSTGEIVKASLRLIGHNKERFRKRLRTANPKGAEVFYRQFKDAQEEAVYLEKRIGDLRDAAGKAGLPIPETAILARTNLELREVCDLLTEEIKKSVRLMTFHGSKGLEFDAVFIIGASEGITPDRRAVKEGTLEEERRAFYVAMTRARRYLHIFDTKLFYNKPVKSSRFIRESHSIL